MITVRNDQSILFLELSFEVAGAGVIDYVYAVIVNSLALPLKNSILPELRQYNVLQVDQKSMSIYSM